MSILILFTAQKQSIDDPRGWRTSKWVNLPYDTQFGTGIRTVNPMGGEQCHHHGKGNTALNRPTKSNIFHCAKCRNNAKGR